MLKTLKNKRSLIALVGVSTLSVGLAVGLLVALLKNTDTFNPTSAINPDSTAEQSPQAVNQSMVLSLTKQQPAARSEALVAIAQRSDGLERDRAQYMLAADLIAQGKAGSALPLLEGLENRYDLLAPYILLKRGQAQAAAGQQAAAQATWKQLASTYADSPAAAEALYQLSQQLIAQNNPEGATYQATLLTTQPSHPRSIEVALAKLEKNTATTAGAASAESTADEELRLLKLVAYHGIHHPDYVSTLNRLVSQYSSSLTPEDWEAIGFGYRETQNYIQAGSAYAKAPASPTNLYWAGRGQERDGKTVEAIATYQTLSQTFPDTPEAADGLMNLADLLPKPAALATLDQVINRFPDQAAAALAKRADLLEALQSPDSAKQARASILSQYSDSNAAAEIRLQQAKTSAQQGNYSAAINWAQQLIDAAPDNDNAAEAGFLLGKWALKQNQPDLASRSFEQVIRNHSETYYAWRSAVYLNWEVGDFDTVRTFTPSIAIPPRRSPLPTGSATLQELYLLGQNTDAWAHWQTEFDNPQQPTMSEQFTDGILRLGVGDNLNGIFMVSSLSWRDLPNEKQEYQQLRKNPEYWQAIYPFPFSDIIKNWAQARQLNPLLVTGLVRQESRFQPQIESVVGAVGLMQVMPETATWISEQTSITNYSLTQPEDNVKFGTWFLDFTHEQFQDNSLFAVASYNAGPGAVDEWIQEGGFSNADEFVEKIPYPETKGYISAVFGGYWNYLRLYNPEIAAKIANLDP